MHAMILGWSLTREQKMEKIIRVEPTMMVATTKLQKSKLEDPEEGEHLFHS